MKILSFDIEDWFHLLDHPSTGRVEDWGRFESRVEHNTDQILSELASRHVRATFFCLGWIAEHHPALIRRIDAAGHEIGTHSHAHRLVSKQTPKQFEDDLARSMQALEAITGKPVRAYRAPGFSVSRAQPWVFETLVRRGISIDCSVFLGAHAHGGDATFCNGPTLIKTPAGMLQELPVMLGSLFGVKLAFSGGGYFRALPYGVIRQQFAGRHIHHGLLSSTGL